MVTEYVAYDGTRRPVTGGRGRDSPTRERVAKERELKRRVKANIVTISKEVDFDRIELWLGFGGVERVREEVTLW